MKKKIEELERLVIETKMAWELPRMEDYAPIRTEPWMKDFVKERHSREEWEWFMDYCEAETFRRICMRLLEVFV